MNDPVHADELAWAERFSALALECVHREYPNKIAHVLSDDDDVHPPRELTPAFYGCFDWHSSVHGHWLLARLARRQPEAPFAADARAALDRSLSVDNIAAETSYLNGEGRASFERPYGLAWLLQLANELRDWAKTDDDARRWSTHLEPLEAATAARFAEWLPKLLYPIRTGEHSQTAFALGLVHDWAVAKPDDNLRSLVEAKAREFHLEDRDCPLAYEPGGQDFLSPCLAEADLMRRVLATDEFSSWLREFLPETPTEETAEWLPVGRVSDRSDGKLVHLDGLNLSRAWMLEGIAAALSENDPRRASLRAAADRHREAGLASVTGETYEGGHWLASFATYLVTGAGLP